MGENEFKKRLAELQIAARRLHIEADEFLNDTEEIFDAAKLEDAMREVEILTQGDKFVSMEEFKI